MVINVCNTNSIEVCNQTIGVDGYSSSKLIFIISAAIAVTISANMIS